MEQINEKTKFDAFVTVTPVSPMKLNGLGMGSPKRFRDDETATRSRGSSMSSLEEGEIRRSKPKWFRRNGSGVWRDRASWYGLRSQNTNETDAERRARRRRCCRRLTTVVVILTVFGVLAGIVYIAFVATLIRRLAPSPGNNGLQHIVDTWQEPTANGSFKFDWRDDFSRDIVAKNCHSHNDYWRRVPLYEAFAAGCMSIEADIRLTEDNELLVGHTWKSTQQARTLRNLYLDPLANIFTERNVSIASVEPKETGLFDTSPDTSVVLLLDFKTDGAETWPVVLAQLASFREKNWLTYYNGTTLIQGPLTIVGTGNTPFSLVQQNSTNRYIFFDAPLLTISSDEYNSTNSYYASTNMKAAIGRIWLDRLSRSQVNTIGAQIQAADDKGLRSRYWDTPAWPISLRNSVWRRLMERGVGMLNVDDLVGATKWDWDMCVVAGIRLCGRGR